MTNLKVWFNTKTRWSVGAYVEGMSMMLGAGYGNYADVPLGKWGSRECYKLVISYGDKVMYIDTPSIYIAQAQLISSNFISFIKIHPNGFDNPKITKYKLYLGMSFMPTEIDIPPIEFIVDKENNTTTFRFISSEANTCTVWGTNLLRDYHLFVCINDQGVFAQFYDMYNHSFVTPATAIRDPWVGKGYIMDLINSGDNEFWASTWASFDRYNWKMVGRYRLARKVISKS